MIEWLFAAYCLVTVAVGYYLARTSILPPAAGWSEAARLAAATVAPSAIPALIVYLTIRAITGVSRGREPEPRPVADEQSDG